MKIFISWSGERSGAMAIALRHWLPYIIKCEQIFMSQQDMGIGTRWLERLNSELENTDFGIVCLTPENLNATWLLFEAGAISKSIKEGHIVPYLLDLELSKMQLPLSQFQGVISNEAGTFKLIQGLNDVQRYKFTEDQLTTAFLKWWTDLKIKLDLILPINQKYGISITSHTNNHKVNWKEHIGGMYKYLPDDEKIRLFVVNADQSKCWMNTQKVTMNESSNTWEVLTYFGLENQKGMTFYLITVIYKKETVFWIDYIAKASELSQQWHAIDYPLPENVVVCQKIKVIRNE